MLGVIIGVGSVVTLLAIGAGVSNNITSRIATTGTNILTIPPDNRAVSGARFTTADVEALASPGVVPEVIEFIPSVNGNLKVTQAPTRRTSRSTAPRRPTSARAA